MPRFFGIVFYQQGRGGWSEVYPINAASYSAAFTLLDQANTLRLGLACADVFVAGNRISDTDVLRDSFVGTLTTNQGQFSLAPNTSGPADETYRTLVQAGQLKRGTRHLHALPAGLFVNGTFTPSPSWTTQYNGWAANLVTNISLATKIRGAMAPPFYTFSPITATANRGNGDRKVGRPFGLPRGRRQIV